MSDHLCESIKFDLTSLRAYKTWRVSLTQTVFSIEYLIWLLLGLQKEIQNVLRAHFDKGFT